MKIVLSRKGFDSGTGQVASPILPSAELCWLPIPESWPDSRSKQYAEIMMGNHSLGAVVKLTKYFQAPSDDENFKVIRHQRT